MARLPRFGNNALEALWDEYEGTAEVFLTKRDTGVTCTVYGADGTPLASPVVDSVSARGSQLEVGAWMCEHGFQPVGEWKTEVAASPGLIDSPEEHVQEFIRVHPPAPDPAEDLFAGFE